VLSVIFMPPRDCRDCSSAQECKCCCCCDHENCCCKGKAGK
jgi:hypothetical protein